MTTLRTWGKDELVDDTVPNFVTEPRGSKLLLGKVRLLS
jgi:hypothetical protein